MAPDRPADSPAAEASDRSATRLTIRIDLVGGNRLGPGKIALLQSIARHGSISAAGRKLGMSYRRCWLLVDTLNRMFHRPVVSTRPGGGAGGGAWLTEDGQALLDAYLAIEQRLREDSPELDTIEAMLRR